MQTLNTRKKAFTLVELIITITILAILGTIAYISFQGFVKDARDGTRLGSIKNIEKGVEISFTETGKYPQPDLKTGQTQLQTGALSISGSIVEYSYLGEIGTTLTRQLRITKTPTDPLTQNKYTYATTIDGKKYQVASILENPSSYRNTNKLINQANAANGYVAKVSGNHQDIVIKQTSNGKFITVVPSIVFDGSGSNILNQSGTLVIVNNKGNLPYSPDKSTSLNNTTTAEQVIREVRGNQQATTVTLQIPDGVTLDGSGILNGRWNPTINKNNTNWKLYSTGTILASLGAIDPVTGGADYNKLTAVLNGQQVSNTPTTQTTTTSSSYNVGNSLMFNGSSNYLSRTFTGAGNQRKWTWSGWIKKSKSGDQLVFASSDNITSSSFLQIGDANVPGIYPDIFSFYDGADNITMRSTAVYRDPSAWYHIVLVYDTTQSTRTQRVQLYVNGQLVSLTAVNTGRGDSGWPTQNIQGTINRSGSFEHRLGMHISNTYKFDGYMTDINFVDSGALDPTSFGQFDSTTGQRTPKQYTGSYGTNGFHLDFSSGSNLGYDSSGNGKNWQVNGGITQPNNQMLDSPTNNFATLNPLDNNGGGVSAGNLLYTYAAAGTLGRDYLRATQGFTSGKWEWQVTIGSTGTPYAFIGIADASSRMNQGFASRSYLYGYGGTKHSGNGAGGVVTTAYTTAQSLNDVIKVRYDNGSLEFFVNGESKGVAFTGLQDGTTRVPYLVSDGPSASTQTYDFGQKSFIPSAGFNTLSTANLPEPDIKNPKQYFDILTYTGNGSNSRTITGLLFQPDLVWLKYRNVSGNHYLFDSIRGTGQSKGLYTNLTGIEGSQPNYGQVTSFNSDGFSIASGAISIVDMNYLNDSYVAWNWKKGSGVGVNGPGFDIQIFSGSTGNPITINHSLGSTPKFVVFKDLDASSTHWGTNYLPLGTGYLWLESSASWVSAASGISGNDTTITIGGGATNTGHNYISYLWSEVPGYSKFGSYIGNNNIDGPFIYTGFKPRFILFKSALNNYRWEMYDTARNQYNISSGMTELSPNESTAESSFLYPGIFDILSNGFKIRSTGANSNINVNNDTIIYAAFAEAPFKYATAR